MDSKTSVGDVVKAVAYLNLLTTPEEDLEAAFDLMEGKGFFRMSASDDHEHTVKKARERLTKYLKELEEDDDPEWTLEEREKDKMYWSHCIYGCGGWHRYFVRGDGTIDFSAFHANFPKDKKAQDASDVGFRIHR
jgi:hypothetical protein